MKNANNMTLSVSIDIDKIIYMENCDRKTFVVCEKGEFTVNKTFKEMKEIVAEKGGFVESHKSFVVNKRFVEGYDKTTVFLKCGDRRYSVHISRRKYEEFVKKMG